MYGMNNDYIALKLAQSRQNELAIEAQREQVVLVGAERERLTFINRLLRETRNAR